MNKQIGRALLLVIILASIWTIIKFGNGLFTIPLWVLILVITRFNSQQVVSILIVSEFFIGLDTFTLGSISMIQVIGFWVLIRNIKHIDKQYSKTSLFIILVILLFYLSLSYYSYFKQFSFAPINWIFIYVLTVITFKGEKEEFYFLSWLTVLSISLTVIVNLILHISMGVDAVNTFGFGNPNQIGFFGLFALLYIIYLNKTSDKWSSFFLKILFYVIAGFIVFTGGRLNSIILLTFIFLISINERLGFWLKKVIYIYVFIFLALVLLGNLNMNKFFFRENEKLMLRSFTIKRLDDLKNPYLTSFTNGRSRIYYDAIRTIKERPFLGIGFLSWNDKENSYNSLIGGKDSSRFSMHSTLLQYLAESGIIGLMIYLVYLLSIWTNGRDLVRQAHKEEDYMIGLIIVYLSLFMILGSTFDNHSLSYAQIHFAAAISTVMLRKYRGI